MTPFESSRRTRIVGADHGYAAARLIDPTDHGYLLLAAETSRRPVWLPNTHDKRVLLDRCRLACTTLRARPSVLDATTFDAFVIPPGRGAFLDRRPGEVHMARYDLVVLVETTTPDDAAALRTTDEWMTLKHTVRRVAANTLELAASNVRRMGDVDHTRAGVYLFNYFFADDTAQNIAVWERTAGWWQQETDLDNSEVLLPRPGETDYTIINHCRWDRLTDFLPALLLKRSFHTYLQANFDANDVAPMPILYRRAG